MKLPPAANTPTSPCPGCSSDQPFPLLQRECPAIRHGQAFVAIEVYIKCTVCPFERRVRLTTKEAEKKRKRLHKLRKHSKDYHLRYGAIPLITERQIRDLEREIVQEETEIAG